MRDTNTASLPVFELHLVFHSRSHAVITANKSQFHHSGKSNLSRQNDNIPLFIFINSLVTTHSKPLTSPIKPSILGPVTVTIFDQTNAFFPCRLTQGRRDSIKAWFGSSPGCQWHFPSPPPPYFEFRQLVRQVRSETCERLVTGAKIAKLGETQRVYMWCWVSAKKRSRPVRLEADDVDLLNYVSALRNKHNLSFTIGANE